LIGVTNREYLEKNSPVNVNAEYWAIEILSVSRYKSMKDAPEMSHFDIGAQKWTVNGPGFVGTKRKKRLMSKRTIDMFSSFPIN